MRLFGPRCGFSRQSLELVAHWVSPSCRSASRKTSNNGLHPAQGQPDLYRRLSDLQHLTHLIRFLVWRRCKRSPRVAIIPVLCTPGRVRRGFPRLMSSTASTAHHPSSTGSRGTCLFERPRSPSKYLHRCYTVIVHTTNILRLNIEAPVAATRLGAFPV